MSARDKGCCTWNLHAEHSFERGQLQNIRKVRVETRNWLTAKSGKALKKGATQNFCSGCVQYAKASLLDDEGELCPPDQLMAMEDQAVPDVTPNEADMLVDIDSEQVPDTGEAPDMVTLHRATFAEDAKSLIQF